MLEKLREHFQKPENQRRAVPQLYNYFFANVDHVRNKRCLVDVFQCQIGLAPQLLEGYFKTIQHHKETRGNNINLVLRKVHTEAVRKSSISQGTKIFKTA